MNRLFPYLESLLEPIIASSTWRNLIIALLLFCIIAVASFLAYYLIRFLARAIFTPIARRTKTKIDDAIIERKVLSRIAHMAPAIIIYYAMPALFPATEGWAPTIAFFQKCALLYLVLMVLVAINAFLNAFHDFYETLPVAKDRPIKTYVQLVKIIIFFFGGIVLIAILINKDPSSLLLGLSAMAAVLMLVFKDTILGLVASVQASANEIVKPGDWIVMPSRDVDGDVLEITLNTVKVQNFDRTISTFPTYALVSESIRNYKGMQESDGRRIKRSIFIDVRTIHFCSPEEIANLKRIELIREYIETIEPELEAYNENLEVDLTMPVNGRRLTNIGVFREYINRYLNFHPGVSQESTRMARLLQPTEYGLPIEVYCFCLNKVWVNYEGIQSDIFDHLLAVVKEFNLAVFQSPTGMDYERGVKIVKS